MIRKYIKENCVFISVDMRMPIEMSAVVSPRIISEDGRIKRVMENMSLRESELEPHEADHSFRSMNAVDILRETVRILRFNLSAFMLIAALLICPVSAILLSNALVDPSIVKMLTVRLMLVARSIGLPLEPFIKQSWQRLAEMGISSVMCFPLFITMSLLSKAGVVYSIDCTYSRKKPDMFKFCGIVYKIWRRLLSTYVCVCVVTVGCLAMFLVSVVALCNVFSIIGFPSDILVYLVIAVGLIFLVVIANCIIICNIAIVISVLEDVSGPQALLTSWILIRAQTQVGLLIFLGSTIGMAFVEGMFEHRVKTLSYGDGFSRIWEGSLLVVMYSLVVLIDSMMSAVFYFSCRSYNTEALDEVCPLVRENISVSPGPKDTQ